MEQSRESWTSRETGVLALAVLRLSVAVVALLLHLNVDLRDCEVDEIEKMNRGRHELGEVEIH